MSLLRKAALVLAAWTFVGSMAVAGGVASALSAGRPLPTLYFVVNNLAGMWLWALYTPLIFALCRRHPLVGAGWRLSAALHAALFGALWSLELVFVSVLDAFLVHPERTVLQYFFGSLAYCLFCYLGALAVGHALRFHALYVERTVRASELQAELLRAQLLALQMQLRPHFLFNTLHTVSGLVRMDEKERALQVVADLADLLRAVLRGEASQQVPLRQEMELVERYLGIEQARFQDRLRTHFQVEPEALGALVPQLLLQPLVENAVRHGACASEAGGRVSVHIRREAQMLCLCVEDSGPGLAAGREYGSGAGIGLANTRARLRHLFGERHRLSLTHTAAGGTLAEIAIPYRCVPEVS